MSGLNCFGPGQFFQPQKQTYFPDNPPLYMNGNPNNPNFYASMTMPVNFTVRFNSAHIFNPAADWSFRLHLLAIKAPNRIPPAQSYKC